MKGLKALLEELRRGHQGIADELVEEQIHSAILALIKEKKPRNKILIIIALLLILCGAIYFLQYSYLFW